MITDFILKNHECHKDVHFKFAHGLNVFVGDTSAGKSSVFRAMYWLQNNRPLGNQMLPLYWQGTTEVEARFINPEATIVRIKDEKDWNHYIVNDEEPINAGNKGAPDPVPSLLLMDDVNFQLQIDRAFLMFDSPGERGKILNKIAGLEDIDKTTSNAKSDELKLKQTIEKEEANLEAFIKSLSQYDNIEDQERMLELLENLNNKINQTRKKIAKLSGVLVKHKELSDKIELAEKPLKYENQIQSLKTICKAISDREGRVARLDGILAKLERNRRLLEGVKDYTEAETLLGQLKAIQGEMKEKQAKIKKIQNQIDRSYIMSQKVEKLEGEILTLEKQLPKICPTCKGTGRV